MDESYKCFRCDKEVQAKDGVLMHRLQSDIRVYPHEISRIDQRIFWMCDECAGAFDAWLYLCKKPAQQWPPMELYPDGWREGEKDQCSQPKT